jgi:hypothetical protein
MYVPPQLTLDPFGTAYEIEVEHTDPDTTKKVLEDLFVEHGVSVGYSQRSKFGNMKAGSII